MVVDWQHDPIKNNLLHVDMLRIDLTKRLTVKVPVHTSGDPVGVKQQGGLYEIITREVEIECLPDEIPEAFHYDVSLMELNQSLRASELTLTGSMKLISPAEQVISHVITIRTTEEAATTEEGATAAAPEPEVIKKGKKEEEGAEAKDEKKKK
jgi:large subunit ribosomal protein L25